jgi:hypothetical protein
MIIRQASLDAFKQMAIAAFEDEMVEHCQAFSPAICRPLGKEPLRLAIQMGLEQANARGFTRRGSSQFYLECMLLFGSGFTTDPQYPWIAEVLARNDFEEELHKSEALYETVKRHLDEVAGTDNRYVRGCLRRLLRMVEGELPVQQETFAYDMARIFDELHPEKTEAAGPVAIEALLQHAAERARYEYGFTGTRSVGLLAILMWFSGYRCDEDPFHPWIREALTTPPSKNTEAVGATLEKRAVVFFETFLQELI